MIQVRTPCHKIPNFIEMAKRAGVTRVFIGLENVNLDNLAAAKKRQNSINGTPKNAAGLEGAGRHYARRMHSRFPLDTPENIRHHIAIIQEELPLDIVEFFGLTPLPGSEDHRIVWKRAPRWSWTSIGMMRFSSAHESGTVGDDLSPGARPSIGKSRGWKNGILICDRSESNSRQNRRSRILRQAASASELGRSSRRSILRATPPVGAR
jgi:hypothetical protein